MSTRRIVVFVVDGTHASEALVTAIDSARTPPWKPNGPGVPFGSPQVRYTEEEAADWIVDKLREAAPHVTLLSQAILP
jgi:hypothetical protein